MVPAENTAEAPGAARHPRGNSAVRGSGQTSPSLWVRPPRSAPDRAQSAGKARLARPAASSNADLSEKLIKSGSALGAFAGERGAGNWGEAGRKPVRSAGRSLPGAITYLGPLLPTALERRTVSGRVSWPKPFVPGLAPQRGLPQPAPLDADLVRS